MVLITNTNIQKILQKIQAQILLRFVYRWWQCQHCRPTLCRNSWPDEGSRYTDVSKKIYKWSQIFSNTNIQVQVHRPQQIIQTSNNHKYSGADHAANTDYMERVREAVSAEIYDQVWSSAMFFSVLMVMLKLLEIYDWVWSKFLPPSFIPISTSVTFLLLHDVAGDIRLPCHSFHSARDEDVVV